MTLNGLLCGDVPLTNFSGKVNELFCDTRVLGQHTQSSLILLTSSCLFSCWNKKLLKICLVHFQLFDSVELNFLQKSLKPVFPER